MICPFHTFLFYIIDDGIAVVFAPTVVLSCMYMHHQWLATDTLGDKPCLIGEPVMCVYDIKIILASHGSCYQGITIDFLQEVIPILP